MNEPITMKRKKETPDFAIFLPTNGSTSSTACLPTIDRTYSASKPPGTPPATEYPYVAAIPLAIDVSIVTRFIFHPCICCLANSSGMSV